MFGSGSGWQWLRSKRIPRAAGSSRRNETSIAPSNGLLFIGASKPLRERLPAGGNDCRGSATPQLATMTLSRFATTTRAAPAIIIIVVVAVIIMLPFNLLLLPTVIKLYFWRQNRQIYTNDDDRRWYQASRVRIRFGSAPKSRPHSSPSLVNHWRATSGAGAEVPPAAAPSC